MRFRTVAVLVVALAAGGVADAQTTHQVSLFPISFSPTSLTINVGDTVQWTWISGIHNVESGAAGVYDGNFRSGDPTGLPGTTWSLTFDAAFLAANPMPGNFYPYYCVTHIAQQMFADITVLAGTPPAWSNYGCGRNPSGSLVSISGQPQVAQTWTVGVHNPLGTQPAGSLAFLALSFGPDPNYPCGTPIPSWAMSGPTQVGELLLSIAPPNPILTFGPTVWGGAAAPAAFPIVIPPDPSVAGIGFNLQGAIADPFAPGGVFIGLTEGMEATIGS